MRFDYGFRFGAHRAIARNLSLGPVEDVSIMIDPRAEWRQILREAWRLNRDFFYAPNYHGVDWNGVWKKYEPLLDHAATRSDGQPSSMVMSEKVRVTPRSPPSLP